MYAVHYSQLDTLQILLENGADVNLQMHGLSMILYIIISVEILYNLYGSILHSFLHMFLVEMGSVVYFQRICSNGSEIVVAELYVCGGP